MTSLATEGPAQVGIDKERENRLLISLEFLDTFGGKLRGAELRGTDDI